VSLKYLLDTNIVSEAFRPHPAPSVLRNMARLQDEIAISCVVWHELRYGIEKLPLSKRRAALQIYLDHVVETLPIIDYDRAAAEWHARERARLVRRGETPPFSDGQIAAVAVTHDLTLVTFNHADFRRFKELRIADWT
jgi:tRNA(fMet)-specific endonuclease VapC